MEFPQKKLDYFVWAIACLVVLSALSKIRLLFWVLNHQQIWSQILIIVFFLSAAFGAGGLLWLKKWAFFFIYIYIMIATFFLSISIIPFIPRILGLDVSVSTILLLIINIGILSFTAFLHLAKSKEYKLLKEARQPGFSVNRRDQAPTEARR
jgi:hypothetical protein